MRLTLVHLLIPPQAALGGEEVLEIHVVEKRHVFGTRVQDISNGVFTTLPRHPRFLERMRLRLVSRVSHAARLSLRFHLPSTRLAWRVHIAVIYVLPVAEVRHGPLPGVPELCACRTAARHSSTWGSIALVASCRSFLQPF